MSVPAPPENPPHPTPAQTMAYVAKRVNAAKELLEDALDHVDGFTTDTALVQRLEHAVDAVDDVVTDLPISDVAFAARRGAA